MKRQKDKNNCWENLQGFRYAHRGLFHQPRSASIKLETGVAKNPLLVHIGAKKGQEDKSAVKGTAQGMATADAQETLHQEAPHQEVLWKEDISRWKSEGRRIVPENSMKAFRNAVHHGFGSELDVHLTADGKLVVFHDDNPVRMTGVNARIEDMTWQELSKIPLLDTDDRMPLLEQVLDLYTSDEALTRRRDARPERNGALLHLPLIIELKAEGNAGDLCSHVMEMLDRYPTLNYCVESFDPRAVLWLSRHRPDVFRGQLTENFMKSKEAVRQWGHVLTFGMWSAAPDIITRPDFISCKFSDRRNVFIQLSYRRGVRQVNWIIRNQEQMNIADREGGLSIFERFIPDWD